MPSTLPTETDQDRLKTDYSLTGFNHALAIEKGLAEADWYQCYIPRDTMRHLLERKDGPGIRDTLIWFLLLIGCAYATVHLWGTWWAVLPYALYSVLYASTSDSRWHESSHGTAFKTDWMNRALYEIASFMVMRESTVWRWSHNRHHSDTIIVGRDPEIVVMRPPDVTSLLLGVFGIPAYRAYFSHLFTHALGKKTADEQTYIPESEFPKIYTSARISLLIYLSVIAIALYTHSILPILLVGGAGLFGSWLMPIYGLTQHAGLAENVLDHRLNCRTVYMNPINRYLYWNMNYHVEHHMFPLVPYHALPRLHDAVKHDCPEPYSDLFSAWKEIIPAISRQTKDPSWYIKRKLPERQRIERDAYLTSEAQPDNDGWIEVCDAELLKPSDVIRFDVDRKTYAIYKDAQGKVYASDGMCTHGNTHLSDGLIVGSTIECPKHNGRFNLADGSPARAPICVGLRVYETDILEGKLRIQTKTSAGLGAREEKHTQFTVVSAKNISTFIREIILEADGNQNVNFTPGDYLQVHIPEFETVNFRDFTLESPYEEVWSRNHLFELSVSNKMGDRRNNYSIASHTNSGSRICLNVRIATPPPGQDCPPGVGSSFMFGLKPGDRVIATGPFGDFHIKPTQREMLYIGGGAGMAPLRSHISHLFETAATPRKVSYWYGARSKQEIFYDDYFKALAEKHHNFRFELALSSPMETDLWEGNVGFIHEVVFQHYLKDHPNPSAIEFYLCGPPQMIKACNKMLDRLEIPKSQIAYDEF